MILEPKDNRDALWDAIRRSVDERNKDPEKMKRWLEDFAERTEN